MAYDAFVNAITDPELQLAIRLAGKKTTTEALAYALTFEAAKQASRTALPVRRVTFSDEVAHHSTSDRRNEKDENHCWHCHTRGKEFDLSQVLHGEQYLTLHQPLPTYGDIVSRCKVIDVLDKGKHAGLFSTLVRDQSGGFGGKRSSSVAIPCLDPPSRSPDTSLSDRTSPDQAALYRLSGDVNPLHIDPDFARISGYKTPILHGLCSLGFSVRHVLRQYAGNDPALFKRLSGDVNPLHIDPDFARISGYKTPILHGLCSLGFSVRHVLRQYAGNDPALFKSLKVRFAKPVLPGQTLRTDMWQESNRIHFQTSVAETNQVVISGAYVDLKSSVQMRKTGATSRPPGATLHTHRVNAADDLISQAVFDGMLERVQADPSLTKKVNGVFVYVILKNGKKADTWTADLKKGKVYKGEPEAGVKADTTITVEDSDLVDIVSTNGGRLVSL
ncbi:LOW QUALITY PROTEIN: peroxisomal multifunctional enzyme type 2 [Diaphorina citri]|uniref:LOW QUALITY PROTEIN: peroxisomal multifunctional enzyme type 2 n=1 Tax=Diaphorina citri TaxID=121845 RepID=A0A1S4EJW6_DIACI|nr:LOW QUALITY PROTEIN: peroxisomal multifunctional enzyme type 2 [Diaphorina citri]